MLNNPKFLAVGTVLIWSLFTPFVKLISINSQFLFVTLCFACTFCTFVVVLSFIHRGRFWTRIKSDLKAPYLFFGLFGYFLYWMALNQCFRQFSSASGSTILNYTWPIFTVLFSELIFRRAPKGFAHRILESIGIVLGFASVYVLATGGNVGGFEFTHVKGLLWGILAGAAYGFFSAYSSTVPRESQGTFLLVSIAVSLLAMLPFGLTEIGLLREMSWKEIGAVFMIGSVFDGGGYFLWTAANRAARDRGVDISAISSIVFFLPLLSVIAVSLFWGEMEIFRLYFLVALALLISGSFICQRAKSLAGRMSKK